MNDESSNGKPAISSRTRKARIRFGAAQIAAVARLCSRGLNESESCRRLGLRPQSWFTFKSRGRNNEKFSALLEEFTAGRIDDLVSKIEAAADGKGLKQPDWRSAAMLLKYIDNRRFGDSPQPPEPARLPIVTIEEIRAITDKLFAERRPKQLNDKPVVETPATVIENETKV